MNLTVTKTPLTQEQKDTLKNARVVHTESLKLPPEERKVAAKEFETLVRGIIGQDFIGSCVNGSREVTRFSTDFENVIKKTGSEQCEMKVANKVGSKLSKSLG